MSFLAALFYNVIIATVIARLLWLYALESLPTGIVGISSFAIPVIGVLTAWLQLGERPDALEASGLGLIMAALAVLTARRVRASRHPGLLGRAWKHSPALRPGWRSRAGGPPGAAP